VYRGGKYQIYEGGTRIPLIVRWPGHIKPGVSDALVTQVDFLASFARMVGQQVPEGAAPDSRDCLDTLLGKDAEGSEIILEQARGLAIRKGPWKYLEPHALRKKGKTTAAELYNTEIDIGEQNNIIDEHPDVAKELAALLDTYRNQGLR
jgi:arylsulfatase A-like enzyme